MSQQARKEKEGNVVRRLTIGAGAAALGLSGLFTTAAATGLPLAFASGSAARPERSTNAEEDDVYIIRHVHVQAIAPSLGGVKAATASGTSGRTQTGQAGASATAGTSTVASPGASTVTSVTTTTQTVRSAPAPPPTPAAATGGSAPRV